MLRRLRGTLVLNAIILCTFVPSSGFTQEHEPSSSLPIQLKQAPGRYEGDDSTFVYFTPTMDAALEKWFRAQDLKRAMQRLRHIGDTFCEGNTEEKAEELFVIADEAGVDREKLLRFVASPELGLSTERITAITTIAGRGQSPAPTVRISKEDLQKADDELTASLVEQWETEFPRFSEVAKGKPGKTFAGLIRKFQAVAGTDTEGIKKISEEIRAWGQKHSLLPLLQDVVLKSPKLNLAHDCKARLNAVRQWSGTVPPSMAQDFDLTPIKDEAELIQDFNKLVAPFTSGKKLRDPEAAVESAMGFAREHGLDQEKLLGRLLALSSKNNKKRVENAGREAIALSPLNRDERLALAGVQSRLDELQSDRGGFKNLEDKIGFLVEAAKLRDEAVGNATLSKSLTTLAENGYFGKEREAAIVPLLAALPLKEAGLSDLDKFFTAAQQVIRGERDKKRDPANITKKGKLTKEEAKAFEAFRVVEADFAEPAKLFEKATSGKASELEAKAQEKVVKDFLALHKASALAGNADELKAVMKDLHGLVAQKEVTDDFKKAAQSFVDRYHEKNKAKADSIVLADFEKLVSEEKALEGSFALGLSPAQKEHILALLKGKTETPPPPPVPVNDGKALFAALSQNPEWKPLLDRMPEAAFEKWFAGLSQPANSEEFLTAVDALVRKLTPATADQAGRFLVSPADRDLFIKMAQSPTMLKAFGAADANDDRVKTAIGLAKAHSWSNDRVIDELRKPQEKPDMWALQQRLKPELEQKRVQQFSKWFGLSPTEAVRTFEAVEDTVNGQPAFVRRLTWEKLGGLISGMPDAERIGVLNKLKGIEASQRSPEESWTITALEGVLKQRILTDRERMRRGLPSNQFQAVRQNVFAMEQALGLQQNGRVQFSDVERLAVTGYNNSINSAWGRNGFFAQLRAAAPTGTRGQDRAVAISEAGVQQFFANNPDSRVLMDRMQRYFEKRETSRDRLFEDSAAQMAAAFTQNGDSNTTRVLAWKPDPMFARFEPKEFQKGIKIIVDAQDTFSFRRNLLSALEALNAQTASGLGSSVSALRRGTFHRDAPSAEATVYKLEGNRLVPAGTVSSSPPGLF